MPLNLREQSFLSIQCIISVSSLGDIKINFQNDEYKKMQISCDFSWYLTETLHFLLERNLFEQIGLGSSKIHWAKLQPSELFYMLNTRVLEYLANCLRRHRRQRSPNFHTSIIYDTKNYGRDWENITKKSRIVFENNNKQLAIASFTLDFIFMRYLFQLFLEFLEYTALNIALNLVKMSLIVQSCGINSPAQNDFYTIKLDAII